MSGADDKAQAIEIYRSERGDIELRVRLKDETVWLSQSQMAQLFGVDRTVIVRHIGNIYKSEELSQEATCAKNAQVQVEGGRTVRRNVPLYNLDMIISVGYRVNSRHATRFRQWATSVLKQYLVKGYAINERIRAERYEELKGLVRVMARTIENRLDEPSHEAEDIVATVKDYIYALDTLDNYDNQRLTISDTTAEEPFRATYEGAMEIISRLRDKFGGSNALPMVHAAERPAPPPRRLEAHGRRHPRGPHAHGCRKPDGGERHDGARGG